eukprot:3893723-Alexandrium_andersonii.AAC.1
MGGPRSVAVPNTIGMTLVLNCPRGRLQLGPLRPSEILLLQLAPFLKSNLKLRTLGQDQTPQISDVLGGCVPRP